MLSRVTQELRTAIRRERRDERSIGTFSMVGRLDIAGLSLTGMLEGRDEHALVEHLPHHRVRPTWVGAAEPLAPTAPAGGRNG